MSERCNHGFLRGLCAVPACPHSDGLRANPSQREAQRLPTRPATLSQGRARVYARITGEWSTYESESRANSETRDLLRLVDMGLVERRPISSHPGNTRYEYRRVRGAA